LTKVLAFCLAGLWIKRLLDITGFRGRLIFTDMLVLAAAYKCIKIGGIEMPYFPGMIFAYIDIVTH